MKINDIIILWLFTKLFPCSDFLQMNCTPFIEAKIQWWARPSYAFWDWDRDFRILVSKFKTETETLEISLIFWDWYWDFGLLVSNNETETETLMPLSQRLRLRLRPPWSQSQSRDQSLAHLCLLSTFQRFFQCRFKDVSRYFHGCFKKVS